MSKLINKVAVVTGASKGIGAGIAKALGAAGASVVVNYSSSREGADKTVAEITANGGKAVAIQGDVSKSEDVERLFKETSNAFGEVDVLVNNAAVFSFAPLENVTEDEFHRQFNTNVLGPILATREAAKHFGKNGGSVINISSVVGTSPVPNSVIYSATKAAIENATRTLALELAPRNVRVNAVAPGPVQTEGFEAAGLSGDFADKVISETPLKRIGQPKDIADVVVFLASEDSSWITGERLTVAGGLR
jgi:3-oxoacyl-[acyl-carrier protein] reductase